MSQESHAENMLRTLVNLHEGIADGGLGITDRDWNDAKAVLGLKPMVGARLERRTVRDIMSPFPDGPVAQADPVVGRAYLVNGSGDLAMDYDARSFINVKCEVLRQLKNGKWLVRHPGTGNEGAFAKRNLTITDTAVKLIPTTKDGKSIAGTFEKVQAATPFSHATRLEDGSLELEYEGASTMFWDTSETQEEDGERLYLCEDGQQHKESDLVWEEEA